MENYDLVLMVTDEEGQRTGEEIRVASIRGTRITGRMKEGVERTLRIGEMRLGISGNIIRFPRQDADLVAASLSLDRRAFVEAGIKQIGLIVAVDLRGQEVPLRLSGDDMTASDVLLIDQESPTDEPLD